MISLKKFVFFITLFLILFGFKSNVYADGVVVDLPMAKPTITDNSGYLVVVLKHTSGVLNGMIYQFKTVTTPIDLAKGSGNPYVTIKLSNNSITANYFAGTNNSGFTTYLRRTSSGASQFASSSYSVSNTSVSLWSGGTEWSIIGYYYEGFVSLTSDSSLSTTTKFNVNWGTSTNEFDYLNDILNYIVAIYGDQVDLYNLTQEICINTNSIYDVIVNLFNYLKDELPDIYNKLDDINSNIISTHERLIELYKLLLKQYSQYQGESNTTPPSKDTMNDYHNAENQVIDKNKNPNDVVADVNINLNSNANDVVWNLVTEVLNSHTKVFTFVISMLSLGAIALVLGRG